MNNQTTDGVNTSATKKKNAKRVLLILLTTLLTVVLAAAGIAAYTYFFHEPDTGVSQPPPFDTGRLNETEAETAPDESGSPETVPPETEETTPPESTEMPKSEQKIYNFLFVGQDRIALNTDVIMLVSFNTTKKNVTILQLPRDTYIRTGYYAGKLNGLYAHYYLNHGCNTKIALRMVADTLEKSLCVKIHNVGHINLDGVVAVVDAIGGVDVNVPNPISYYDDATKSVVYINAGVQHLNGAMAEQFIRHRATYLQADIGRMDAQKAFVSAFIQKLKTSFSLGTVAEFVDIASRNVTTDVSVSDAVFYAKQLLSVDMSNIGLMSMIGRGATGDGLSYWVMVRKNMLETVNRYFNIYDFEITDAIFDPERIFTNTNHYPHFNNIYTIQDIITDDPHSAGDINDDSIYIPHT